MPEQPQWSERTLDMPPQDPWAEAPTTPVTHQAPHHEAPRTQVHHPHTQAGHTQAQQPAKPGQAHAQTQVHRPDASPQQPGVPPFGPHGAHPAAPEPSPFSRGRARVTQRTEHFAAEHEPTGTGWPAEAEGQASAERQPLSWHIRRLRRGSEWSNAPLIFAFVSWGIWVLSTDGSKITPIIVFITSLCVAAGVFALARLAGRLVLERQLGRVRHTARGAHMATGVFLIGVGLAHLQQTEWVMTAVHWVTGLFGA
ncbi:DNA-directed RNA polymerase II [Actinoplanes sp. DH11]|uniref:DNA-directed RNA polymerase II n=1 Tax=Actinoplanes sp. DH11 TaxID=2857011 RepID=UPI001E352BE3|nr:DNA-directed RNA polymerase II [Actinoplanes sp. DH11]